MWIACTHCNGTGANPDENAVTEPVCPVCEGCCRVNDDRPVTHIHDVTLRQQYKMVCARAAWEISTKIKQAATYEDFARKAGALADALIWEDKEHVLQTLREAVIEQRKPPNDKDR